MWCINADPNLGNMSNQERGHVTWVLEDESDTDTGDESVMTLYSESETETDTEFETETDTESEMEDDYVRAGTTGIRFLRLMRELRSRQYGARTVEV